MPDCLEYDLYFWGEKMVITESEANVIDQEWMALILEAKELGLSIEDVRDFINQIDE